MDLDNTNSILITNDTFARHNVSYEEFQEWAETTFRSYGFEIEVARKDSHVVLKCMGVESNDFTDIKGMVNIFSRNFGFTIKSHRCLKAAPVEKEKSESQEFQGRSDFLRTDNYFMAAAFLEGMRSKDPSTQVGACLVNARNKVVALGHNRMPDGCDGKFPWSKESQNEFDTKYAYVVHAEADALMNRLSGDVTDCRLFVTLFPCNKCAQLIIVSGIKRVVFKSSKYWDTKENVASRKMLDEAGVSYTQFTPDVPSILIDFEAIEGSKATLKANE